ncbi:caspase-3-like [Lucilia sericata]|uniref:caspase-3-like n=1 Tax=Lucilia sericata TaxID=13632 RepID=UPI0018A81807|nr:caspase-3-like [Lucilia sericata]
MDQTDLSLFKRKPDKYEKTDNIRNERDINCTNLKQFEKQRIISRPTKEDEYRSDNPHAGVALIFNHKYITGERQREGTEKDRDAMEQTLLNYGFDVRVFNDLTWRELNDVLAKTAQEDHSNNDCLVVTVMSHGSEGRIYARDISYPVERLWNSFLGEKCRSLINKPKLFFIQACRGQNLDKHVIYSGVQQAFIEPRVKAADIPPKFRYVIPNTADILIMFSTFEKYSSFRNVENGSWFIQSLCSVLNDAATNEAVSVKGAELLRLLTAVNRKVAYEFQSFSEYEALDQKKEMPNFLSTLTKTFYLRVKNGSTN